MSTVRERRRWQPSEPRLSHSGSVSSYYLTPHEQEAAQREEAERRSRQPLGFRTCTDPDARTR